MPPPRKRCKRSLRTPSLRSSPDSKDRSYLRVVSFDEMTKMIQQRCNTSSRYCQSAFLCFAACVPCGDRYRRRFIASPLPGDRYPAFAGHVSYTNFPADFDSRYLYVLGRLHAWHDFRYHGSLVRRPNLGPGWGVAPPFIVPWKMVGLGCLVTVGACFFGTFFPALYAASAAPYRLLKAAEE